MANEEHLAILKQGVEARNRWREENIEICPDLRHADLSGANLRDLKLYSADLRGSYLRGADIRGANLSLAYLYHADFSDANMEDADLAFANLSGARLENTDFTNAKLFETIFADTDLSAAKGKSTAMPTTRFQRPRVMHMSTNLTAMFSARTISKCARHLA